MRTKLHIEQENDCHSGYLLPLSCWDVPSGTVVPGIGDVLTLMAYSWGPDSKPLEPRSFEVVKRHFWIHAEPANKAELAMIEVQLLLRDLGPVMRTEDGLGALGRRDPAYPFPPR